MWEALFQRLKHACKNHEKLQMSNPLLCLQKKNGQFLFIFDHRLMLKKI